MTLKDDLSQRIKAIFQKEWLKVDGRVVPATETIALGNVAKEIEGAVLYADIDGSTQLVDTKTSEFAAELYKAFHLCCTKIARDQGGEIRSFDGDRLMAVFIGSSPCSDAATAALKISWAVQELINPLIKAQYGSAKYTLKHTVGIDYWKLFVVRAGIRDNNDLVWIGPAANHAAKLNAINDVCPTWITDTVYNRLIDSAKFGGSPREDMWQPRTWTEMNNRRVYCSRYRWSIS